MESILKIAAIALAAVLCAVVVKKQSPEMAAALSLAAGTLILLLSMGIFRTLKQFAEELSEAAGLSGEVFLPVIKTVAIAIITRVTAEMCRDAKEGGIAAFVELAGTGTALVICVPLMQGVLSMINGLL